MKQHLVPRRAAVLGLVDAARAVRLESLADCGDPHDIVVARIDLDRADMARVVEADMVPGLAAVHGFVHAVAADHIAAQPVGARADINDVGVVPGDRDVADRRRSEGAV